VIESRTRVVYWFNQPTPYVVARFNAVAERGSVEFEAWFSEVRQSDRSWDVDETEWKFPARYIPVRRLLGIPLRVPLAELLDTTPDVFVLEYDRLNQALGAVAGKVVAKRLTFRVLPNIDAWSHRTWWRESAKHLLFRTVDGVKIPGPDGQALAMRYGAEPFRASVVRQSIDLGRYGAARAMTPEEREARRSALGLSGCVFLFVGRLWQGKGLDELFTAYRKLELQMGDKVSLLVVGDGVDQTRYRPLFESLPRVVLPGFVQPVELPQWYALADCLVFPTHGDPNGLVVEEAFAAGLPVIVSDAAGDIHQRVPEGVAGYVFAVGSADELYRSMAKMAMDPVHRQSMADRAVELVKSKSVEGYAADFDEFVAEVVSRPPRRGFAARLSRVIGWAVLSLARLQQWRPAPYVVRGG
jgi:glycosyltransferase involved in cell wall biosynthesis